MNKIFFYLLESKNEYPFNFITTYSKPNDNKEYPIKYFLSEFQDDSKEMMEFLSFVDKIAEKSVFLRDFIQSGEFYHPIGIEGKEANMFLQEMPIYEELGIVCRLPKWIDKKQVNLAPIIREKRETSMDVLGFDIYTSIDGQQVSIEELRIIAEQLEPLAQIKNKWIKVDKSQIKKTIQVIEKLEKISSDEVENMMELKEEIEEVTKDSDIKLEMSNRQWLEVFSEKLKQPAKISELVMKRFKGTLKDYQTEGAQWINYMHSMGLGCCLAFDMGLGKTPTVISFLNHQKNIKGKEKTLILIPTSLLKSWTDELAKFAPHLNYYVIHSSTGEEMIPRKIENFNSYDIFISTYGTFSKHKWIMDKQWSNVIIDEAQAIKSPDTQKTVNVKKLKANFRLAMTGTPFENNLMDLWSIFDFLNEGLLGTQDEFKDFCSRNKTKHEQIKEIITPFILRKMKTDRAIAPDLPEKSEENIMVSMSVKQIALYSSLIDKIKSLENPNVLPYLVKFKQITNHPSQYLGQEQFDIKDSGKFLELKKLCTTIKKRNEKVIIFTQFKEIIDPLMEFVGEIFGKEGLCLHGSTPAAQRGKIVDKFQSGDYPFIICSIKACGVGLTLTASNNVIHFDRWYNPAVENQATDRAYRIGQTKNVNVYKFITKGTIEEGIDRMLEEKKEIFNNVIPQKKEKWLNEYINEEMLKTFKIS